VRNCYQRLTWDNLCNSDTGSRRPSSAYASVHLHAQGYAPMAENGLEAIGSLAPPPPRTAAATSVPTAQSAATRQLLLPLVLGRLASAARSATLGTVVRRVD